MKSWKTVLLLVSLLGITLLGGCKKDDGINVHLREEANQFIWQSMNLYYFWQSDVPDLSDGKFDTFDELFTFLNTFDTPEGLFYSLNHPDDRFSWIVDDYEVLDNAFQGISKSFGYEFGLVQVTGTNTIFGFVEYIVPGSPADNAGLKRGDVFYAVDGVKLDDTNYINLLFEQDMYTLSLGDYVGPGQEITPNGVTVPMSAVELTENPIFLTDVIDVDGTKIGYLVFNQFINTFHSELNAAIGQLQAAGVTEMVLDLRYNTGGSVTTARALASMLYDDATSSDVFASIIYNEKLMDIFQNEDLTYSFLDEVPILNSDNEEIGTETMNRLALDRLFILTGRSTASASELIIAGLDPFMDVTLIGMTTVGKNVGSITLYDSPNESYLNKNGINPNHTYAIQPIISRLANSQGFSDYTNGIAPDVQIDEIDHLGNLIPLGDPTEPLLAAALDVISGAARIDIGSSESGTHLQSVFESKQRRPANNGVWLDSKETREALKQY